MRSRGDSKRCGRHKAAQREIAVAPIGDIHDGRVTLSYSPDVAARRLRNWGRHLGRVREALAAGYQFDELVVPMLGDMLDGAQVFKTQHAHVAFQNPQDQADHLVHVFLPVLRDLAETWGRVRLVAVPGNHGRVSKTHAEANNWDVLFYDLLDAEVRADGRLAGSVGLERGPRSNPFFLNVAIGAHRFLLYHGDKLTRQAAPARIAQWQRTAVGPFDVALLGHLHHCEQVDGNGVTLMFNGSPLTDDDHSLLLGHEAAPRWWAFGVSRSRAVTWQFKLDLGEG